MKPSTVAKAIAAFAGLTATGIGTAAADGRIEVWELAIALLGALAGTAGVWATPNAPA